MAEVRYTRNLFLRGMCIIYLFAFLSFYVQIPGLYGDNGVLPARSQVDLKAKGTLLQKINQKPTLLWLAPFAGLNVEYMMDLIALFGSILSFLGFISQKVCIAPVFASLWALYFSLFQVGQVFVQNNWDALLLEAGFLCILIAPVYLTKKGRNSSPSDALTFWTIRWLLFRYMFSCSISKLASKCSSWWTLDALSHYFENQCLPAPLGWYAHHLPTWFLRFNTVLVFVFEIVIALLFFFPLRKVRITAYYIQMFLQVHIITTGNWNFRDFLVICGLIALLDDQFFYKKKSKNDKRSLISEALSSFICVSVYTTIVLATIRLFKIKLADNWTLTSEFVFTQEQFDEILPGFLKMVVIVGLVSMAVVIADSITYSILTPKTVVSKITTTITTAFYVVAVIWLFVMSTVPLSSLHQSQNMTVPLEARRMYNKIEPLHIVNGPKQFALFPKMTGLNGRPEIIIEGSNDIEGPWKEFEFLYKPGNVNNSLPFVAPHTPRLDWQMWWAAQGTYHQNPWIMSLAYRILTGQKEVTALLNDVEKPFGGKPPKYVRATLYHYHFAPWRKGSSQSWWTRERIGEYFPIYSRDHTPLLEYLTKIKVLQPTKEVPITNDILKSALAALRTIVNKIEPSLLLWSIFTAGCAIIITGHSGSSSTQKKK